MISIILISLLSVAVVALIIATVLLTKRVISLYNWFDVMDEQVIELGHRINTLERAKHKNTDSKYKTGIDNRSKEMKRKQQVKKGK